MMPNKRLIAVLELVLGLTGFALFWYATDWVTSLGLFIVLFGNNIGHSRKFI